MQKMDKTLETVRLQSLVSREQKNQWERFGFSPDWSFKILPIAEEGENAEKYIVSFFSKGDAPVKQIFLKKYLHPQIDRVTIENEFQGLRLTYEAFKEAGSFRVPQPYGRLLDEKIIFMEYYPSVSFKRMLFRSLRLSRVFLPDESKNALLKKVADAGKMLALFQQIPLSVHPTDERETSQGVLLRYEKQFLNHLRACHDAGLPEGLLRNIQKYILERIQVKSTFPVKVLQHSDFAPWNLMVSENELCLTDFQNFTVGFPYFDAAFFYSSLDLLFRYRTVDRSLLSHLQSVFLESFLAASSIENKKEEFLYFFKIFRLMHMVYFAQSMLQCKRSLYEPLYALSSGRFILDWFNQNLEE
jgi:tRNA A-37 threonylcarbamoyl transferase component Bud32